MLHTQEFMQQFTGEMLSAAVLGSGVTSTICGKMWIDCYKETFSDEDQLKVMKEPSSKSHWHRWSINSCEAWQFLC